MNYDSPFVKMLETIANMLIVSFLWLIFALPVVTLVPSCAAMYHTVNKVIFGPGKGNGVFRDFYQSFKENLVTGIKLTLIMVVLGLVIAEGLWTGYQLFRVSIWGMLYMMLGVVIALFVVPAMIYIAPVLSRFDAPVTSIIRISVYLAMKKPLRSLFNVIILAALVLIIETFPLALLVVPAVYADILRAPLERDLAKFMKENNLAEETEETVTETEEQLPADSSLDLDCRLSENRKKGRN